MMDESRSGMPDRPIVHNALDGSLRDAAGNSEGLDIRRRYWRAGAAIAALGWIATLIAYPWLPSRIPMHWNLEGKIDGYGDRWTAFLVPGIIVLFLALFRVLPWLSPKRYEVEDPRGANLFVMVVLVGLMTYIQGLVLVAALGWFVDVSRALMGGVFAFIGLMGLAIGSLRRNFYVGIRTPWTLASEQVWVDTHRLGGWVFLAIGIFGVAMTLLGSPLWVPLALLFASVLGLVLFSLVDYKRLQRQYPADSESN